MSPEMRAAAERRAAVEAELRQLRELNTARQTLGALRIQYGRPLFLDVPVRWRGRLGVISGTSGPHVLVTLADGAETGPIHPADDDLVYLVDTRGRLEEVDPRDTTRSVGIVQRFLAVLPGGGVASW